MNSENENFDEGINLNQLLDFIKKIWLKTTLRIVISLFFTLVLFALLYALLPSDRLFTRNIGLKLHKNDATSEFSYPNGKSYVDADLLSQVVLRKVYDDNKLEGRVDFSDFVESFFISDYDAERAKIEAEHRAKLSNKGIKISEIQSLELQYKKNLASLPQTWRSISMKKLYPLKKAEQIKIINEIPAAWFEIYSKLEALPVPVIPSLALIADLEKRQEGSLSALEMSRIYLRQFSQAATRLHQLSDEREIKLRGGETLGDIQNQIAALRGYQFPMLYQYFLMTPALRSRFDLFFIQGQLDTIERRLTNHKVRLEASEKALEIVAPRQTSTGGVVAGNCKADGVENMMMDQSFLPYFAQMVRNEYNNSIRKTVASQLISHKEEIAELEAEKQYYHRLLKGYTTVKSTADAVTVSEFDAMFRRFQKSMAGVSLKLTQLKELLQQNYMAKRNFYTTEGNVIYSKSPLVPPVKLLLGLFALFAIYNAVAVLLDFNKFVSAKQD